MSQFKTQKSFGEFLKFISLDNLIEQVCITFENERMFCKFQDREKTFIGEVTLSEKIEINENIVIYKIDLFKRMFNMIGPEIDIFFNDGFLSLNNDKTKFKYLIGHPSIVEVPKKTASDLVIKFNSALVIKKEDIVNILSGMQLIDDTYFTISCDSESNIVTFTVGDNTSDNFIYEVITTDTINESIKKRYNKDYFKTILTISKDNDVELFFSKKTMLIDIKDDSNNIHTKYLLAPAVDDE